VIDADVIARRILVLEETLQHLRVRLPQIDARQLVADPMLQAAVERWLQVAVEACIDIAYHVVAARGWPAPEGARDAFEQLAAHGIVAQELATRLGRAAGMRNILVHHYVRVDRSILAGAVHSALVDLEEFGALAGQLLTAEED
jgi:uncharacterized protein YutE (UPF0331/DUF86 family)